MINVSVNYPLIAQVGEKVRIDAKSVFTDPSTTVASVEIRPLASGDFYDVSEDKILDWVYDTEAEITATVKITDDSETPVIKEVDVIFNIVSAETDKLFSSDLYLLEREGELSHYIPEQYSTFNHVHREVQRLILEELKTRGLTDSSGNYLTKSSITHTKELRDWATNLALSLIYFDISSLQTNVKKRWGA